MNISDLRKIIHEEVVKAMREEFREILLEAVQIQDNKSTVPQISPRQTTSPKVEKPRQTISISEMLQETAKGMNRDDYKALFEGQTLTSDMVSRGATGLGTQTGIPEQVSEMPDFISRAIGSAKAILDTSLQKDIERHAL